MRKIFDLPSRMLFPKSKPKRVNDISSLHLFENNVDDSFISMTSQWATRLLRWILIAVLIQALILVFWFCDSPQYLQPPMLPPATERVLGFRVKAGCENRSVYVYDLPPAFNNRLLEKCRDLDHWVNRCLTVSNGGFGPKATDLGGVVPRNLTPAWYWTDMYAAEVMYHTRMLNYKCRTLNPEEATAFYVPFYAGLAIAKYLWYYPLKERDRPGEMMLDWLTKQPSWKKHDGADHFLMLGRLTWDFRRLTDDPFEWGARFTNAPLMKNVLKIIVERFIWDDLEFSVPYPTAFHPRTESDIVEWQRYIRSRIRHSLFSFVGGSRKKIRNDFRALLLDYCKSQSGSCRVVDCSVTQCSEGAPAILEAFLDSNFCLQPIGDGSTRRSFFDCMLAGSIPVYFWEKSFKGQYDWHLPLEAESYSVFIDNEDVRNGRVSIRSKLEEFSEEEIKKKREAVIDFLPRILYAESSQGFGNLKDAFDITIEGVLRKVLDLDLKEKKQAL